MLEVDSKILLFSAVSETVVERLAVPETILNCVLGPSPPGAPGEGPDYHFPQEFDGFGPIPTRIRGAV